MSKNRTNWDHVKWTAFEEVPLENISTPKELENQVKAYKGGSYYAKIFVNSIYQVEAKPIMVAEPYGRCVWLSFKTRDKQARHDWREIQRIKNEIVGEHYEAVELYPDEDRLVDTSNQFHLWVFLDYKFPFGFHERLVSEGSFPGSAQGKGGYRQRDFRPELKAPDTLANESLRDLMPGDKIVGRCPIDGSGFVCKDGVYVCMKSGHKIGA